MSKLEKRQHSRYSLAIYKCRSQIVDHKLKQTNFDEIFIIASIPVPVATTAL